MFDAISSRPRGALLQAGLLVASCLGLLVAGCSAPTDSTVLDADPGRAAFEHIPPPIGTTVGADPLALAQALYGISEPVEGNYSEQVELLSETATQQIVLFTQIGLPDDSVRSQRHRLEFEPQGSDWQLTWVGQQVQCWPGRGHEDWGTAPCS
jgi:hypothetical protein